MHTFLPGRAFFFLRSPIIVFLLLLLLSGQPALGQEPNQPDLTREYKGKVIDWIGGKLDEIYVFPDVAQKMQDHLQVQLEGGAYDRIEDLEDFLEQLTTDLRSISHDKHLGVSYASRPSRREDETDEERKLRRERMLERERTDNFMFKKVEHLGGNVGYLRFDILLHMVSRTGKLVVCLVDAENWGRTF